MKGSIQKLSEEIMVAWMNRDKYVYHPEDMCLNTRTLEVTMEDLILMPAPEKYGTELYITNKNGSEFRLEIRALDIWNEKARKVRERKENVKKLINKI